MIRLSESSHLQIITSHRDLTSLRFHHSSATFTKLSCTKSPSSSRRQKSAVVTGVVDSSTASGPHDWPRLGHRDCLRCFGYRNSSTSFSSRWNRHRGLRNHTGWDHLWCWYSPSSFWNCHHSSSISILGSIRRLNSRWLRRLRNLYFLMSWRFLRFRRIWLR